MDAFGNKAENALPGDARAGFNEACITRGALRMHCSRQRRRDGLRCLTIELREAEIERLATLGYLQAGDRGNRNEVLLAIYRSLEDSVLGDAQQ